MNLPGILAVGERISEIEALVDAIRSDHIKCISAPNSLWTIDNKYYTAQVAISMLETTNNSDSLNLPPQIDHQAVVAVFNATVDTLDTMQRLWAKMEGQECEFEIKLAVLLCTAGCESPNWLEKANAWFVDRATELVVVEDFERVGAPRPEVAVEGAISEGLSRVIEALQAHVWPGMQRKRVEGEGLNGGASGQGMLTATEPSITALLQAHLYQEDNLEDGDGTDKLFSEILEFRQKMGGSSRRQRADAAADIVTRLHALMGENSEASGSFSDSDEGDEKRTSPTNEVLY